MTKKQRRLFEGVYTPGAIAKYSVIKDDEYVGWIRVVPAVDYDGTEKFVIVYGDWIEETGEAE